MDVLTPEHHQQTTSPLVARAKADGAGGKPKSGDARVEDINPPAMADGGEW